MCDITSFIYLILFIYTKNAIKAQGTYIVENYYFFYSGNDVIAQAQSGTGKTATFAISILQNINTTVKKTQALVIAPTRELAQQVR